MRWDEDNIEVPPYFHYLLSDEDPSYYQTERSEKTLESWEFYVERK